MLRHKRKLGGGERASFCLCPMVGWLSLNQDLLGLGLFLLIRVSVEVGDKGVRGSLHLGWVYNRV